MRITPIKREYKSPSKWRFYATQTTIMFDGRLTNFVYILSAALDCELSETLEIYKGENYVVGETSKSWSRSYKDLNKIPVKYKPILEVLKEEHKNIDWNKLPKEEPFKLD